MDDDRQYIESPPTTAPEREYDLRTRVEKAIPTIPRAAKYVVAIAIVVVWIIPLMGFVMASIRPLSEIINGWWHLQGMTVTFDHYLNALSYTSAPMGRALINTVIVTVPSVLVVMILGTMVAYPFARFDFPTRNTLFFLIVMVMAAPPELVAMGNYNMLREIGLFNTFLGLMLIHIAWGMGWVVLFLRNYLLGLPKELEEAARIDGASRYQIFRTIILPFSGPALVSVAVIQFTWVWNSFFFPTVFMRSPDHYLAPQALPILKGHLQVQWGLVTAGSVMTMAVPIVLFVLLQRYYEKGMVSAVAD